MQKPPLQELFFLYSLLFMADCCILITIYSLRNVFSTAMDGGGSTQSPRFAICKTCCQTCTRMYRFDMTALSACIFLPLLLCSGGVFPLALQKPQMLFDRPRMDVVLCSNEFDIPSNSLSSVVQGRTTLDRGYRFNRCP